MIPMMAAGLLMIATPVRAQDGGSRSVFANGTGSRALSMGGAFVAVADDASGLLWNPGGIGRATRFQFEAGQASYFGQGTSESYLLTAIPNWRWGVAALALRRYGMSGIEQRDDRNFVVVGPTSDSQTEVVLGYGRSLSPYWSVGGALKARRQSLAGFSAGGYGADIGVTAQPALAFDRGPEWSRDITVGVALTNLIRPSLRLDRDAVADPASLRTGLAWHHLVGGARSLIVTADVEHPGGLRTQFHSGAELQLLSDLAVRAGLNGAQATAGTSVRWRDVSFDYTFESKAFDNVHRVGLSYAFGPTVVETRDLAARAAEAQLQARMAQMFESRKSEQIDSLMSRARARFAAREFAEAIDLLGTVSALDSTRHGVTELQAAAYREQAADLERAGEYSGAAVAYGRAIGLAPRDTLAIAGRDRCQQESDVRAVRSSETRHLFARALDAFGADDWLVARASFRQVINIQPNDQDAAAMLQRTDAAIARRVAELLADARRNLAAGQTDDATEAVRQAAALDPFADGIAAAQASIVRAHAAMLAARAAAARPQAPAPAPAPVASTPTLSRREMGVFYQRGLAAMQQGRSDEALKWWDLVWSADPKYQQVTEYLKREYLTRGMVAFAAGRLDEASESWSRALRVDPTDAQARGYLQRVQKQKTRTRELLGSND